MKKKILSLVLVLMMVLMIVPAAFAETLPDGTIYQKGVSGDGPYEKWTYTDGTVYYKGVNGDGMTYEAWTYPDGTICQKGVDGDGTTHEHWTYPDGTTCYKAFNGDGTTDERWEYPDGKTKFVNEDGVYIAYADGRGSKQYRSSGGVCVIYTLSAEGETVYMKDVYHKYNEEGDMTAFALHLGNKNGIASGVTNVTIVGEPGVVYENVLIGVFAQALPITLNLIDLHFTASADAITFPYNALQIDRSTVTIHVTGDNTIQGITDINVGSVITGDGTLVTDKFTYPAPPEPEPALENITKTRTYTEETFTDIAGQWYTPYIQNAYEYGIISGVGNNAFNPAGNLTGAEALTIGARIHMMYKYGSSDKEAEYKENYPAGTDGNTWATAYIQYCKDEGLIGSELDDKMTTPITRAEMVFAWSKLIDAKDMVKTNTVNSLPDVTAESPYHDEIIMFYEAGIISGTDALGTFKPDNNITRAECATIFMRLIEDTSRSSDKTFGS